MTCAWLMPLQAPAEHHSSHSSTPYAYTSADRLRCLAKSGLSIRCCVDAKAGVPLRGRPSE